MTRKTAVITGGTGGLGLALDAKLRAQGWTTVLIDLPGPGTNQTEQLADRMIVPCDLTDTQSMETVCAQLRDQVPSVDLVIYNAGITCIGAFSDLNDATHRKVFEINYFAAVNMARALQNDIRDAKGTHLAISSVAGFSPLRHRTAYSASKHALEAATEALYFECHPFGIRLLIIQPGGHDTEGYRRARSELRFAANSPHTEYGKRFMAALQKLPGAGQPGDPQAVARAIYDAVETDHPKFRYPVGEEAEIIRLRRQLDDEEFEQAMRTALDIWD